MSDENIVKQTSSRDKGYRVRLIIFIVTYIIFNFFQKYIIGRLLNLNDTEKLWLAGVFLAVFFVAYKMLVSKAWRK